MLENQNKKQADKEQTIFSSYILSAYLLSVVEITTEQPFLAGAYDTWLDLYLFTKSYCAPVYILNLLEAVYISGFHSVLVLG